MHEFTGKWITNEEFFELAPRNVFSKQLERVELDCSEHRNRHILFRKKFNVDENIQRGEICISADDYYKLYINGHFVAQGPSPSYHFQYNYNVIDVSEFLHQGENLIAVHTLYQGLINRVWQSGDNRHGLILDLFVNGRLTVKSDESFKTALHSAYEEMGVVGYDTQFMEIYDSGAAEVGFQYLEFNDISWGNACLHKTSDHILTEQKSKMLEFEEIKPVSVTETENSIIYDYGSVYVGCFTAVAKGTAGQEITVLCGQELNDDGSVRYHMRANCSYEEKWILAEGESTLDWFDYKSFRYVQLVFEEKCELADAVLVARHYPFELKAELKEEYKTDSDLCAIWDLCVNSQKYGVQEVIQDCMDREKGFYVGDGCYTALTNMILTGDDSMVRKLIDDAFATSFITKGLVTCLDCSFMQEIAEFPLILIYLVWWHYKLTGDIEYLKENYPKIISVLDSYREDYERDSLLGSLDKWCVVEWPANYQDGYDVDIKEGKVCVQPHISLNAYYIEAIRTANKIARVINMEEYRDEKTLISVFYDTFYNKEKHLFKDGRDTKHISIVGNSFPFAFGLCPDEIFKEKFIKMLKERKISSLSLFCAFLVMEGLVKYGEKDMLKEALKDEGAWRRIIREGGTTTFEGWGRDTKWNTSLFHLTMTYAAVFLADIDHKNLFEE